MFLLELSSSDMFSALGRLLDQARVADLRLAAVSARADAGTYRISASIDIADRAAVDRLSCRMGALVCIGTVEITGESPSNLEHNAGIHTGVMSPL